MYTPEVILAYIISYYSPEVRYDAEKIDISSVMSNETLNLINICDMHMTDKVVHTAKSNPTPSKIRQLS